MAQSLDEFLKAQANPRRLRVTLETVADPEQVKVTPWLQGGCGCYASLSIPRKAIGTVSPTGDQHLCCGKFVQLVDIEFSDEGQIFPSLFAQLLVRDAGMMQPQLRAAPDTEACQQACGDAYQSCLEGCDPRDGGCIYTCKLRLQGCLKRCKPPPPEYPPDDIPTERCKATIAVAILKDPVVEDVQNTLRLSGAKDVRSATIDRFTIVRAVTTTVTPGTGYYIRSTGRIQIPGFVDIKDLVSTQVLLTTGSVESPGGVYAFTGTPLDSSTRMFILCAAGAVKVFNDVVDYLVTAEVTLSRMPA